MRADRIYRTCLVFILVFLFLGSYFCGVALRRPKSDLQEEKGKSVEFSLAPVDFETQEERAVHNDMPSETTAVKEKSRELYYDIPLSDGQQSYVFSLCEEYGLPCELVLAVMGVESSYIDGRISEGGDYGIMQINVINHGELAGQLGVSDFLDFEQNVLCGVYILSEYYRKYTDFNRIAMCYRYGEAGAQKMWEKGVYSTDYTRQVVRQIATLSPRS